MTGAARGGALGLCLCSAFSALAPVSGARPASPPVRAVVLGIAQDGGVPHIGCRQERCAVARRDPARRERVACLGLVDDVEGRRFLIDATPDLPSQLESLDPGRAARVGRPLDGILLTHAHIGHYTGLMYLGREALAAQESPSTRPRGWPASCATTVPGASSSRLATS